MKYIFQIIIMLVLFYILTLNPFVLGLMYASIAIVALITHPFGIGRYFIVGLMALVGTLFVHWITGLFSDWFVLFFSAFLTFAFCKCHPFYPIVFVIILVYQFLENAVRKIKGGDSYSKDKTEKSCRTTSDNHSEDDIQTYHKQKRLIPEASEDIIDIEVISEKTIRRGQTNSN